MLPLYFPISHHTCVSCENDINLIMHETVLGKMIPGYLQSEIHLYFLFAYATNEFVADRGIKYLNTAETSSVKVKISISILQ